MKKMDNLYDFRHECGHIPWRLVEEMEPPPFKTFRSEFHMSSTNEHSTTYTTTTHYSKQYLQTKSTKKETEIFDTDNGISNGRPPERYTTTTHITQEPPSHNYSMQFSEIKSLKRVHKVHEGIGTDSIIDTPGIINPYTGETMTVHDAIASRILDVRTGKILCSPDGTQVTIEEALRRGLIDVKIAEQLYSPCGVQEDGRNLTLLEAIQREIHGAEHGFSDPTEKRIKVTHATSIDQAINDGTIDPNTGTYRLDNGEVLSTKEAFEKGYLHVTHREVKLKTGAVSLYDAINQGLIDERTGWIVDRNSGNKYQVDAAVKTNIVDGDIREIIDPKTDNKITVIQALEKGIINPKLGKYIWGHEKLPFLEAKRRQFIIKPMTLKDACDSNLIDNEGKISSPLHQRNLTILEAISRGVLDSNSIKSILNASTGEFVTLNDALAQGIILPEGKFVDTYTNEVCSVQDAVNRGYIVSVAQKSIFDIDGFQPPDKSDYISFNAASAKGFISKNKGGSLVTNLKSGKLVPFEEGVKTGEVKPEVYEMLTRNIGIFENGRELTVIEAVFNGYIDPKTGNFIDVKKNKVVPLNDAIAQNLITAEGAALLNSLLIINVTTQTTSKLVQRYVTFTTSGEQYTKSKMTYTEALSKGYIDNTTQTYSDPETNQVIPIVQALNEGKIAPDTEVHKSTGAYPKVQSPTKTIIKLIQLEPESQISNSTSVVTTKSTMETFEKKSFEIPQDGWPLREAIHKHLFDAVSGLFTVPRTDRLVSFKECIALKIINPESALVVEPKTGRNIPLARALDKRILDDLGRYNTGNTLLNMKDAIAQGYIIFEEPKEIDNKDVRTIHYTSEVKQMPPVFIKEGVVYDPSVSRVVFTNTELDPVNLIEAIQTNVISPDTVSIQHPQNPTLLLPLHEAINQGIIDKRTGEYIDGKGNKCNLEEAAANGKIMINGEPLTKSSKQKVTMTRTATIIDPVTGENLPLQVAFDKGLIDEEMLKMYQTQTFTTVSPMTPTSSTTMEVVSTTLVVTDPQTGKTYTIKEALQAGLITPEEAKEMQQKEQSREPIKVLDMTTIDLSEKPSPAEITRSRITTEPKYKVAIGRAHSLSPAREAKQVVLQKLRRKIVRPNDALEQKLLDEETAEILQRPANYITPQGNTMTIKDALEQGIIDGEAGKIVDPQRGDIINIKEAIDRGILDPASFNEVLIPLNHSLSIPELFEQGLIDPETGKIIHPESGDQLTLQQAIVCDIVDPLSIVLNPDGKNITLAEAIDSKVIDGTTSLVKTKEGVVNVVTAVNKNIFKVATSTDAIPPAGMTFQVALNRGLINIDTKEFTHPITLEVMPLQKAIDEKYIMTIPSKYNPNSIDIMQALDKKLIDPAKGVFHDPRTVQYIPISEAIDTGILTIDKHAHNVEATSVTEVRENVTIHTVTTTSIEILEGYVLISNEEVQDVKTGEIISVDEARTKGIIVDVTKSTNTTTVRDVMSFSDALNKGLVDMNAGTFMDPNSGEKVTISDALKAGLLEASTADITETDSTVKVTEMNIAEAFDTIYDQKTGKFVDPMEPHKQITFKEALEKEIVDPNSIIYDVKSQKPITIEQAVEKGLIDETTGQVKDESGKGVDFKKAAKMGLIAVIGGLAAPVALPAIASAAAIKAIKNRQNKKPAPENLADKQVAAEKVPSVKKPLTTLQGLDVFSKPLQKEVLSIGDAIKEGKIQPNLCCVVSDGKRLPYMVHEALAQNILTIDTIVEIVDKNTVVIISIKKSGLSPPTDATKENQIPTNQSKLISPVIKPPAALQETILSQDVTDTHLNKPQIVDQPIQITNEPSKLETAVVTQTVMPISDAIKYGLIEPERCNVFYLEKQLPYTLSYALQQHKIDPQDGVTVINRQQVELVKPSFKTTEILANEIAAMSQQQHLTAIQEKLVDTPSKRISDLITDRDIDPMICRVSYRNQELPYTVQDGLTQQYITLNDYAQVTNKNKINLLEHEPVKVDEDKLSRTLAMADEELVKYDTLSIGDALNKGKITPETCLIVLNGKKLDFTVHEGLITHKIDLYDPVKVIDKNIVVLVEEKLPKVVISAKNLTPQSLAAMGYYDLQRRYFINPKTMEGITFYDLIYKLHVIDPEAVLVRDLSKKKLTYLTLNDAIGKSLIDMNYGYMVDPRTGKEVPFFEAVKIRWIIDALDKPKEKYVPLTLEEIVNTNEFDPKEVQITQKETGKQVPLVEALKTSLIDPKSVTIRDPKNMQLVPYYQAVDAQIVDLNRGEIINTITQQRLKFPDAFWKGYILNIPRPLSLYAVVRQNMYDPQSERIIDPLTKQQLTVEDAVARNIVDPNISEVLDSKNKQLVPLRESMRTNLLSPVSGRVLDTISGQLVPSNKAVEINLIQSSPVIMNILETILLNYYIPKTGLILDPRTGDQITLRKAIEDKLVDPAATKIKDEQQDKVVSVNEAIDSKLLDPDKGILTKPTMTLDQACIKGYIINSVQPWSLQEILALKLYNPTTGKLDINDGSVTITIAIERNVLNPEVLSIKEPQTGDIITLKEAIASKLVDPEEGQVIDPTTGFKINLYDAQDRGIVVPSKTQITLPEAVFKGYYDPNSGKFVDPKSKEILKTHSAINRGYLDITSTMVTINEDRYTFDQAITDGIIDIEYGTITLTGKPVDFNEAFERGVFVEARTPMSLSEALIKGVYDPLSQLFLDPRSGDQLTLIEAIEVGLIDPDSVSVKDTKSGAWRKLNFIDAIHGHYVDGNTGKVKDFSKGENYEVSLQEAFDLGILIDNKAAVSIQRAIHQGLYDEQTGKITDPTTERKITLHEAVRNYIINPLLPCYFDKKNKKLLSLSETARAGIIDMRRAEFKDPVTLEVMPLNKALDAGLIVDIETANFGLYEAIQMGLLSHDQNMFVHPANGVKCNLKEACIKELINPETSIVKDTKANKYIKLPLAIENKLIDDKLTLFNLANGKQIDLVDAKDRGLIVTIRKPLTLEEAVLNVLYRPDSGKFADVANNTFYDLKQAIENGLIDPTTTALKDSTTGNLVPLVLAITDGSIDVDKGRVIDRKSKQTYNLDKALEKGLLVTVDKPLETQTILGELATVKQPRECSLEEAIRFEFIDPEVAVIKDPQNGKVKTVQAAITDGVLNVNKPVVFETPNKFKSLLVLYDQTLPIFLREPITFEQALEKDYLDVKTGKYTDPRSNEVLTLKECITFGYVDPDTALVKDTNKKKLVKLPEGFRRGLVDAEKGNVLDSATSKLHTLPNALDSGLLTTPRRGFSLVETITYGLYNPTTGGFTDPFVTTSIIDRKRLTLDDAIKENLIDPSSTVIKDPETGTVVPLLHAIETGLIDAISGKLYNKTEDKSIDFIKAQERGLILPAEERQAVEEKYKLCDENLSKLLHWISEVEDKIASQDVVREMPEELRNQINTMKQIKDDLDQHSGQVSHCQDQVRQLVLTAGDVLSKSEVSALEKSGRNLKTRYEKAFDRTEKLLRRLLTARDELSKLKSELTNFSTWLSKARRTLEDKERALSDLQRLGTSVDSTKEFVSDVIAHQADLRFITMSAQKFVDESKEYLNVLNEFRTTLPSRLPHIEPLSSQDSPVRNEVSLVTQQYRDLLHRANNLSDRLSGVGGRQREYGDALKKAQAWLSDVEPRVCVVLNEPIAGDPKSVEEQLHNAKGLNNEFVANGRLIDNAKQATTSLLHSLEGQISPNEISRLEQPVIELDQKYNQLKDAIAERCQELDTALVQSQGVQDALDSIIAWLTLAEGQFKNIQRPASLIRERLEEQLREQRVFQSDIETHVSSIDSVYLSASELISSSSNTRVAKKIESKLQDVRTRFEKLYDKSQKRLEFLEDINVQLQSFNDESKQFEDWYNSIIDFIESRDLLKLSIEEYSVKIREIAKNKDDKRPLFEGVIKNGKDLVNQRDVIDTAPVRDRVKAMENQWRDLSSILDEKQKLSRQRSEQLSNYESLREQVYEWLQKMENRVIRLESVAVELETLKKQNEELKPITKEYRDYSVTIDKINDVGMLYDSLLRGDRSDSPSRRRSQGYSPTKRTSVAVSPLRRPSQDGRSPSPSKALSPLSPGGSSGFSSRRSSQDGFHLDDLSPVQQQLSEINNKYSLLGVKLNDRQNEIDTTREEVKRQLDNLKTLSAFLDKVRRQLPKEVTPNTKDEADKAGRQLKQILEEMYEKQSLLDSTKSQIKDLLKRKPGALGADNLNGELEEVVSMWKALNDILKDRIRFSEDIREFLDTHDSLVSWLSSKDRMLTVLGPISSDPRMVQSQVQQVQVLREEFRSQQPQLQHFIEVGDSVLTFLGPNTPDGRRINDKLSNVQKRWAELLAKLEERADSLGAAADTSREFDAQLTRLRDGLQAISDNLDELPLDKDPEEQLRKVENLERQLEGQRPLLADLETAGAQLCDVLSDPASRADIQAKLASVVRQYNALQKKLDHKKADIEGSLRDGRQFEASCAKTLGWLSDELGSLTERLLISADRDVLEQQLVQHEPIYRDVLAREHEIIMLLNKGRDITRNLRTENRNLQRELDKIQAQWDKLRKEAVDRQTRLQTCMEHCRKYYRSLEAFLPWLRQAEDKLDSLRPSSFKRKHIEKQLKELQAFRNDVWKRSGEYENTKSLGETFFSACDIDKDIVKNELGNLKERWEKLNNELIQRTQSLEDQSRKLSDFNENLRDLEHALDRCEDKLTSHDGLGGAAKDPKMLDKIKSLREEVLGLKRPLQTCRNQVADLVNEARESGIDANHLHDDVNRLGDRIDDLQGKLDDRCSELQSAATAVTQFNEQVKNLSLDLSSLEAELDGMKPPGRDFKTIRIQIDDVRALLKKLNKAADNVNEAISSGERLVDSGFAPDTVQTREQVTNLSKQLGKLDDRARAKESDLETAFKKLEQFYMVHAAVIDDIDQASSQVRKLKPVASDVDSIRAQQQDFKRFRTQFIEPLSKNIDECNRGGQDLIQSAAPGVNTTTLEKDLEKMNEKWNDLKERINDRERRLDVALLQSGKFKEALDGLDKWLTDTEELVANQKPPSADYKVVKAQLQEQKFLKKMLMDRQTSMSSLFSMGNEIAREADPNERKLIEKRLKDLMTRFDALTEGAQQRTLDLEQAMRVAKDFQDKLVALQDWLVRCERKVKDMELVPTDEEKIQQRIREHGVLHNDILSKKTDFSELTDIASNLMALVGEDEAILLGEKLQEVTDRYGKLVDASEKVGQLLSASRQDLRHLVLTYQDLAAWMDKMEQKLGRYKVLAVHPDKILEQMDDLANLTEDIASRQHDVDSTVDTGVELMRHISSDEALQLKDKLDSLQRRYNELTSRGAELLKQAQVMLPLVEQFHKNHNSLVEWMQGAEAILQSAEPQEGDIARLELDLQELRSVLETINLVGPQLSQASPGEGAATIEGLVTRDNRRFDAIAEQIQRRAERIHLGKQRALEVTTDIDELLEWFREVESQIRDAEKPSAEPDLIRVQLKEHKALNDDISSQKGRVRDVLSTAKKVLRESPPSEDTSLIREKMEDLREMMDTVSGLSSDRLGVLEQALPLAEHFNDTHNVLSHWLGDMEEQVSMLSMPAMRPDLIAQQQDRNEMFVQSINEHKPLVDKLNKTGEALIRLCNEDDGSKVQELIDSDNERYAALKLELRERQQALEKALQESSQFSDKLEGMLRALTNTADQVNNQDPISAHPPKIHDQINDNESLIDDLDKRKEAYAAVRKAADDVINKAPNRSDPAIKDIKRKLDKLKHLWDDVQKATNTRDKSLNNTLAVAERFWKELHAVMATLKELEDSLTSQEPPAVEPKAIQKQQVALQEIRQEIDQTKPEVDQVRTSGQKLMQLCGEPDKPEVKKHIEDLDNAWDNITALYAKREENLIDAMEKAMEFHETLANLVEFLKRAEDKFNRMGPLGSDIDAVKRQIEQLKNFKSEVDPHMVKVEALNRSLTRQAQELTERTSADQAAAIKEPLLAVNRRWDDLLRGIVERQRQLENALLRLGQFQHALDELLVWIRKTDGTLDELKPVAGDPQILEVELAKLKVLINDIQAHQTSVDTLNDAGRQIIESGEGTDEASVTLEKLNVLNTQWRSLMQKAADRQRELEDALADAQHFNAEIQDLLSWLGDVDAIIAASKPVGGLPETATEQLERFMEVYNELEENRPKVETVLAQGQDYLKKGSNAASNLQHNLRTLKQRWDSVTARANDKKIKLEIALKEATEFHEALQAFVDWLTNAEKILSNLKPVSRVLESVQSQIEEHKVFQKDVSAHREVMLNLDKKGTHLKYFSQKQDVILIKNLLISVQHRWERVASKSAERTRALDLGYKEAKEFHDSWSGLMIWLEETEEGLDELLADGVGNNPERIKDRLSKHHEFQRALSIKQTIYDNTMKMGKNLKDKAPKTDEPTIKQMLVDLKNRWTAVCAKSVDRQRKLEEALLYSGQYKDAIAALLEWLRKTEKDLSDEKPVHGDLDTVNHLVDLHQGFQQDLQARNVQMESVTRTGHELEIKASKTDATVIRSQLNELNGLWDNVSRLTNRKTTRLEGALREAEKLHKSVHMLLDWLSEAERTLRFVGQAPEDENTAFEQLEALEKFRRDLREKEIEKDATLELARGVLSKAHPDAVNVIKNWITVIQSRWEEVSQWAQQRYQKLSSHMQSLRDLDDCLEELIAWLVGLESTLNALKREELPMDISATERLIADHKEFMENTQMRQSAVDRVCKAKQIKSAQPAKDPRKYGKNKMPLRGSQHDIRETSPENYGTLGRKQSRTSPGRELSPDPQVPHIGPRFPPPGSGEPEFKSPRVKYLYDKWRHVWMLSWERQRELYAHLAYLREKQRAENFSWDDWRKRFLKFMNHKKSRLTDLFRKMDKDNNGLIPRGDFIDGIINTKFDTNRLEMKEVADMFDRNNKGLIDWKEFIAALRPDWEEKKPDTDAQKIHDEVKRLVMLCTCRQKFRVFQVGEGKYRFGDSQKLRLVRILRSTVMVRVGGGWVALDEFLLKNDPCRAKGRTNIELREQFILADGVSQTMTAFKPKTSASTPGSGSSASSLRTTTGPITKVRERSGRSVPMTTRTSRTPDSQSDTEGTGFKTPKRPYRTTLTPGGSRPSSQPTSRAGSRPGSKAPSRHGSNLSLDSTDDGTPSRIPRRTGVSRTGTTTPRRLGVANGTSSSRPRTPTGLISPASPAARSVGKTRTTTPNAPNLRTASRTRTPSGSNTPVPPGTQTAASRLLRKTSGASDSTPPTSQTKKTTTKEPFRL